MYIHCIKTIPIWSNTHVYKYKYIYLCKYIYACICVYVSIYVCGGGRFSFDLSWCCPPLVSEQALVSLKEKLTANVKRGESKAVLIESG